MNQIDRDIEAGIRLVYADAGKSIDMIALMLEDVKDGLERVSNKKNSEKTANRGPNTNLKKVCTSKVKNL